MLKNITELLTEDRLHKMWDTMDCCKCDKCKEDIMAIALNNLPVHYVSTDIGAVYAKIVTMEAQNELDIIKEIAQAMEIVHSQPRHSAKTATEK